MHDVHILCRDLVRTAEKGGSECPSYVPTVVCVRESSADTD